MTILVSDNNSNSTSVRRNAEGLEAGELRGRPPEDGRIIDFKMYMYVYIYIYTLYHILTNILCINKHTTI